MAENKINYNRDILLVADKKSGLLQAVAGMNEDGTKIRTVKPSMKNERMFMTVEKNSGDMENFFKHVISRPETFSGTDFYKMRVNGLERGVEILEGLLNHKPDAASVNDSRIRPQDYVSMTQNHDPKAILIKGENGKLKAIAKGKDGKLKTVDPTKENADTFLKIDTHGNALENFLKKFIAQFENPSHTGIYVVSAKAVDKIATFLNKIVAINPDDKVLEPYRVMADGKIQEPSQGKYQPLDLNKLEWKEVEKYGLTGESLQDSLKAMAYGHKSPGLLEIRMDIEGKELQAKARLSFEKQPDGTIKIQTHPYQEKPDFEKPFLGVMFSAEDQKQLTTTGNGGRVFELEMTPNSEKIPSLVSLDKLTNRFEAVPLSEIQIPKILKGVELSQEQQDGLISGKGVLVENMDKKQRIGEEAGGKITRIVQYNAVNKNFDFLFTPEQKQQRQQERSAKAEQKTDRDDNKPLKVRKVGDVWIRPVQGGVELTREQFKTLCEIKPVWIEGMINKDRQPKQNEGAQQVETTDQKGQKYNAWVWADQDAGRVRHTSLPPDEWKQMQAKKQRQPAEGFKTQVAVNNDGKTNEATKHSKEPLKKGQTQSVTKQYPAASKKRTGQKM